MFCLITKEMSNSLSEAPVCWAGVVLSNLNQANNPTFKISPDMGKNEKINTIENKYKAKPPADHKKKKLKIYNLIDSKKFSN